MTLAVKLSEKKTMTLSIDSSKEFFVFDDEDTWRLLTSGNSEDLESRLTSLAARLEEDSVSDHFWQSCVEFLHEHGFRYSDGSRQALASVSNGAQPPEAFETEAGKQHLSATTALLNITQERAIQVTLGALRSISCDGSQFQSLLGTQDLLWKVFHYHMQQKLSRLGVLTECLRIEQEAKSSDRTATVRSFLDSIDSLYTNENRHRGLFQRLLSTACQQVVAPTREQLEPSRFLSSTYTRENPNDKQWNVFCKTMIEELRMQQARERREALEGLLVLLYDRISEGIRRSDFLLLLYAFSSQDFFRSIPASTKKDFFILEELAGLICAECTTLWRTLDSEIEWTNTHPILIVEDGQPQAVEQQIEVIYTFLMETVQSALARKLSLLPESLGVLSFGLLLSLVAKESSPSTRQNLSILSDTAAKGVEMVTFANDNCDTFDYLYMILVDLNRDLSSAHSRNTLWNESFYDWQFSKSESSLLVKQKLAENLSIDNTAYNSIGCEIMGASIVAFEGSLLAIDHCDSYENVGRLCKIIAKVYEGNTTLCQQFWMDWETYSVQPTAAFPICKLLDASHRMMINALEAQDSDSSSQQKFVQAVSPFFQLISVLCHTNNLVERTLSTFPQGLLRKALINCQGPISTSGAISGHYQSSRKILLSAIVCLARRGNSMKCRDHLRLLLEPQEGTMIDGPRMLLRLIQGREDEGIVASVLAIFASLLSGASEKWITALSEEMLEESTGQRLGLSKWLSSSETSVSAASLVLLEMVNHIPCIFFTHSLVENKMVIFLREITDCVLAGATVLASSQSASISFTISLETVDNLLSAISSFLNVIRTIIQLHQSPVVQAIGFEMRDSIVTTLASSTDLGQAIAYFASLPISLSLAAKVQGAIEDRSIVARVDAEHNNKNQHRNDFGTWNSFFSTRDENQKFLVVAQRFMMESIGSFSWEDVDLDSMISRHFPGETDGMKLIRTAFAAVRLLLQWGSHAEEMAFANSVDFPGSMSMNDDARSSLVASSPFRLLHSSAKVPLPLRYDTRLASVWGGACLSNLDLLLPFISKKDYDLTLPTPIPSTEVLDLIFACIEHFTATCSIMRTRDSVSLWSHHQSASVSKVLVGIIRKAVSLTMADEALGDSQKSVVLDGIVGLRIVAACFASNMDLALSVLCGDNEPIISLLIEAVKRMNSIDLQNAPVLFESETEVTTLRIATASLAAIAPLYRRAQSQAFTQDSSLDANVRERLENCTHLATELVQILSSFILAEKLDDRIAKSSKSDFVHALLVHFMRLALDILSTEILQERSRTLIENFFLSNGLKVGRFLCFDGYLRINSTSRVFASKENGMFITSLKALQCFPINSYSYLTCSEEWIDTKFDVAATVHWMTQITNDDKHDIDICLTEQCAQHSLLFANISIAKSWYSFCRNTMLSIDFSTKNLKEQIFISVVEIVSAFEKNLIANERFKVDSKSSLGKARESMIFLLSDLLLFFMDCLTQGTIISLSVHINDKWLLLEKLSAIFELFQATQNTQTQSNFSTQKQSWNNQVQTAILSSIISAISLLEYKGEDLSMEQRLRGNKAYIVIVRNTCQSIRCLCEGQLLQSQMRGAILARQHFFCCISVLTLILSKNVKGNSDERLLFTEIASMMKTSDVMESIVQQGIRCSSHIHTSVMYLEGNKSYTALAVLQRILNFFMFFAQEGNLDNIMKVSGPSFAHLLIRNPLFHGQAQKGSLKLSERESMMDLHVKASNPEDCHAKDNFVHEIWLSIIQILTAGLESYSQEGGGSMILDMTLEFLQVYRRDLIFVLKSCGSQLTKKSLIEATLILELFGTMFQRRHREFFVAGNLSMCEELMSYAKFVTVSLAKFLGASGTARELFHFSEKIISESENQIAGVEVWHPLLNEGVPGAKHEAIKFSHYASKCIQRITKDDFIASSVTSDRWHSITKLTAADTDLERSSKLSVTNKFALSMEKVAVSCLSQAIHILWRMHPAIRSFRTISEQEKTENDIMSLVKIGTIIGFDGNWMGSNSFMIDEKRGFESMVFARVNSIDTVSRTWQVNLLRDEETIDSSKTGSGDYVVRAFQLLGFEDQSSRKSIASYMPAPNSVSELEDMASTLTLGHLILVLRWCHTESLNADKLLRNTDISRLAEQCSVLLGTEVSLYEERKTQRDITTAAVSAKVDAQILELMACIEDYSGPSNDCSLQTPFKNGRLKSIIGDKTLMAVRPQLINGVQRALQNLHEKERHQREKRAFSGDLRSGYRRGYSRKSAFRGFH